MTARGMSAPHPTTSLVTVTWNSARVLPNLLSTIPFGVETVIVDNGSTDDSVAIAREFGARVLTLDQNLGFGAACNRGAEVAQGAFLFFANPDLEIGVGAVKAMEACLRSQPSISALNPAILNPDGSVYFKRRSPLLARDKWMAKDRALASGGMATLSGSALFMARETFGGVGGFDENIFLYHEDDDLSARLAARGSLYLETKATVTHAQGTGAPKTPQVAGFKARALARSKRYVLKKHGLVWRRRLIWIEAGLKMLSPLSWLSRRKRAQALGFARGCFDGGERP